MLVVGVGILMAPTAAGVLLLEEPFDVDTAVEETGSEFTTAYPHFSFSGPGTLGVVDGVLWATGNGMQVTVAGEQEPLLIEMDFGFDQIDDLAVGIVFGINSIMVNLFGEDQLSLEVWGPGGSGPRILPFGYSPGASLHLELKQERWGSYEFKVTSASSPGLSFSDSFVSRESFGGVVGLQRTGNSAGFARFPVR